MEIVISNSGQVTKPFLNRIKLIKGDIVRQDVDAIVTVVPQNLEHQGSLNTSIFQAASHKLDDFILEHIYKPKIGDVYAVPGFNLPASNVLIGVMPHFRTEFDMHERYLSNCTRKIMELARCMFLKRVAFPPISSGKHGYPRPKAARLILQGILDRMDQNFEEIRIVVPDDQSYDLFLKKLTSIGWIE